MERICDRMRLKTKTSIAQLTRTNSHSRNETVNGWNLSKVEFKWRQGECIDMIWKRQITIKL